MTQNASEQTQQKVLVFDFGAQYAQLIARRVRDLHVYSEIVPCDITADEVHEMAPSALILSGGPRPCTPRMPRRLILPSTSWACPSWDFATATR